jgi:glycosyltransferase involved in cell wall biosynthesis
MRVTLCIQKIAGLSGGAEKVVVDLANQLSIRGHDVDILSYEDTGGQPFYPLCPGIVSRNIKPFDERRLSRAWRNSLQEGSIERAIESVTGVLDRVPIVCRVLWHRRYGRMIARIRQFIDWHKPDVMIAFMPAIFPYVVIARRQATHKPSIIISNHNLPEADFQSLERWDRNRYDRWLRRRCLPQAEAVTVLLPEYRDWFFPNERKNIHVIGNAITVTKQECDDTLRENVFICVGRLTKTKNHEALIRAFSLIHKRLPDWTVRIFGHGPLHSELDALIADLGLEDVVHLMGRSDKIPEEFSKAKIMVLPSLHEGFPLVVGEAFSSGVPVIGFAYCSGVNRLVRNGENGLLVASETDDVTDLASAMQTLASDELLRQRLSRNAKTDAERGEYSPEYIFGAWNELVKDVAGSRGG